MHDNIELLTQIHEVHVRAVEASKFLEKLVNAEALPLEQRLQFLEIQGVVDTQDLIVRRQLESLAFFEEQMDKLADAIEKKKQES